MYKLLKKIVLVLLMINCVEAFAANDWQAEELFTQIAELRTKNQILSKALNELKAEIGVLKQSVGKSNSVMADASAMIDNDPTLGDEDAPLIIIEYTDFLCPFCKKHELNTFVKLKEAYIDTGKIQYVVKDFSLSSNSSAILAAVAANCAEEQGNYWSMRHMIFENQRDLSKDKLIGFADLLKLNQQAFIQCIDDPKQAHEVENDVAYAEQIGIQSTPSFVIARKEKNRLLDIKVVRGAYNYKRFSQLLDSLPKKQ